jgi:hypothetical protein
MAQLLKGPPSLRTVLPIAALPERADRDIVHSSQSIVFGALVLLLVIR